MKTKKNIISVNGLISDMLFKNKITILIIFLITISAAIGYDKIFKKYYTYYEIIISSNSTWVSDSAVITDDVGIPGYSSTIIINYIRSLPSNVRNKRITSVQGGVSVNFESEGVSVIKVNNFIEVLNSEIKKSIKTKLKTTYASILRKNTFSDDIDIKNITESLETYPEVLKIEKTEQALNIQRSLNQSKLALDIELKEIEFLITNFNVIFEDDPFYTLNGWKIKSNKSSTAEIALFGLLFGVLISSIMLFLRSSYYTNILKN